MSVSFPKVVDFGNADAGLTTVGYTLINSDGSTQQARTTDGVYELNGGCYGANISFPDNWKGIILWDTGESSPSYAAEEYDNEGLITNVLGVVNDNKNSIANVSGIANDNKSLNEDLITGGSDILEVVNDNKNFIMDILKLAGNNITKKGNIITILNEDGSIWRKYNILDGRQLVS